MQVGGNGALRRLRAQGTVARPTPACSQQILGLHHSEVSMHAYQIKLAFRTDGVTILAAITAENPALGDPVMLTPNCVSYRELEVQIQSLRDKLDMALRDANEMFSKHSASRV
jgi:hypothetical protein